MTDPLRSVSPAVPRATLLDWALFLGLLGVPAIILGLFGFGAVVTLTGAVHGVLGLALLGLLITGVATLCVVLEATQWVTLWRLILPGHVSNAALSRCVAFGAAWYGSFGDLSPSRPAFLAGPELDAVIADLRAGDTLDLRRGQPLPFPGALD